MEIFTEIEGKGSRTRMAVLEHPVHPMTVTFPIAFLISVLPSDLAYLYLGDPFWARVSLWLTGAGAISGIIAGLVGTGELLAVSAIRRRAAAWSHFVAAVMMLSVAVANWLLRLDDPAAAILPWGLYLSGMGAALVAIAGWLGGDLVFEHLIGTGKESTPSLDATDEETPDAAGSAQRS